MDYRTFEVNITSAEGEEGVVNFVNFFSAMKVYAVISIGSPNSVSVRTTPIAKYFGKTAVWNFSIKMYLKEQRLQQDSLVLTIQLRRKRIFGEDEAIGEARLSLKDLFDSRQSDMDTDYRCCRFLTGSGGRRGVLYYSCVFGNTVPLEMVA